MKKRIDQSALNRAFQEDTPADKTIDVLRQLFEENPETVARLKKESENKALQGDKAAIERLIEDLEHERHVKAVYRKAFWRAAAVIVCLVILIVIHFITLGLNV